MQKPGSVISCLRDHLTQLSPPCKRAEFKELETEGKDIRLKSTVASSCKKELELLCKDVKPEEKLKCLKKKLHDNRMGDDCKKQVIVEKRVAAVFLKAAPGIAAACKEDLKQFCGSVKPGGGRTHHCLRSNM